MARDLSHATSALTQHLQQTKDVTTQELFAGDPQRFEKFHAAIDGLVREGLVRLSRKGQPLETRSGPYRIGRLSED